MLFSPVPPCLMPAGIDIRVNSRQADIQAIGSSQISAQATIIAQQLSRLRSYLELEEYTIAKRVYSTLLLIVRVIHFLRVCTIHIGTAIVIKRVGVFEFSELAIEVEDHDTPVN